MKTLRVGQIVMARQRQLEQRQEDLLVSLYLASSEQEQTDYLARLARHDEETRQHFIDMVERRRPVVDR